MSERPVLSELIDLPDETTFETVGDRSVPWRCATLEADYRNLRQGAALLDLTGAGLLSITGLGASDFVNKILTREVGYMTADRTIMGMILTDDGRPVDVVTLFATDDGFLVQTSVGQGSVVREALAVHGAADVEIADLADEIGVLAVEGPDATNAVSGILNEPVDGLPFQGARSAEWKGGEVVISRTGVSGEFGFTFLVPRDQLHELWRTLSTVSVPSGIEAVETTMLEVRQPLVYRELLDDDSVVTAGFNWLVDIEKEDFAGRQGVVASFESPATTRRVSIVAAHEIRRGGPILLDDEEIGDVVHAAFSPSLDAFVGVGRVRADFAASGLTIRVGESEGCTATPPVVIPTSWRTLQA